MSVPNQKIIENFNYEPTDKEHLYAVINIDAMQKMMCDGLTLNAIKLWLFLSKNREGFRHLELSSSNCCNQWGIGKSQFGQAFESLVKKGYLVPVGEGSNLYNFIQCPRGKGNEASFNGPLPDSGSVVKSCPDSGSVGKSQIEEPTSGNRKCDNFVRIPEVEDESRVKGLLPESGKQAQNCPDSGNGALSGNEKMAQVEGQLPESGISLYDSRTNQSGDHERNITILQEYNITTRFFKSFLDEANAVGVEIKVEKEDDSYVYVYVPQRKF